MFNGIMIFLAQDFYLLLLGLAVLLLLTRYRARRREWAGAAVVIGGLAFALAQVATRLIADPRPFLLGGGPPLIASATDNGFPSDHTLLVATVAATVTVVDPVAGVVFWGLAVLVGLARVYARVHHLLDVAGSLGIVALALALYWGVARIRRRAAGAGPTPATDRESHG
ncbi:MAG: phosphatase PAP2 family protein [Chloroflexota bacterium]|nr:phosphatase PAP2 family protein [Chloroflexota bacterium]